MLNGKRLFIITAQDEENERDWLVDVLQANDANEALQIHLKRGDDFIDGTHELVVSDLDDMIMDDHAVPVLMHRTVLDAIVQISKNVKVNTQWHKD